MTLSDAMATESQRLFDSIAPILTGRHPLIVSATLADLTAMWVAGHRKRHGTPADTQNMQRRLLKEHTKLIRDLVPANMRMLDERVARGEISNVVWLL